MKKIVFLLLAAISISISFSSCNKSEEEVELDAWFTIKDQNGKKLDGYVLLFQDGEYDPKTYDAESFSVKTTKGEIVGLSYICGPSSFGKCPCLPGAYYAIYHYIKTEKSRWGTTFINTWKGESISIKKGEENKFTFTLDLTKKNGCQN